MQTLQQVEKFVREYIADEWILHYETQIGDMDQASFETAKKVFFEKYFADAESFFETTSHEEKYIRNEKFRENRKSKLNLWRDEAYELFLIKQYQLPTGEFLFRAYISHHSRPRPELNVTSLSYYYSLFIVEKDSQLKIIAKYSVDNYFMMNTSRDKQRMKYLTENNQILKDGALVWIFRSGEIITAEMIEDLTDGVKFVQPAIEHGHAGDYMRPITNNKLGELDLNSIDLMAEVIDQLKNGKHTGRHSGLPYGSWVKNAWDVVSKSNKAKISQALYESLKSDDTWLRMEALVTTEVYGSDLLGNDQCIDLLTNHIDKFAGQRHEMDGPSVDRGESFVATMYRAATGPDKKAALELIRKYALDPKYLSITFKTLAKEDSVWLKQSISKIKKASGNPEVIDELVVKYKLG